MTRLSLAVRRMRRVGNQRGASAIEFAILAPLFFMIVFGMFSGGLLFNEKSQLTYAAREGTRYGSALPAAQTFTGAVDADSSSGCTAVLSGGTNSGPLWACNVAKAVIAAAGGDLNSTIPNRYVCVAVVQALQPGQPEDTVLKDGGGQNYSYSIGTPPSPAPGPTCFDDLGADSGQRVHVLVKRNGSLNAILFSMAITLTSQGVGRAETPPGS